MNKRKQAAIALTLLSTVSAACIKGMKAIGKKIEERTKK